jgi:hypothetical protein
LEAEHLHIAFDLRPSPNQLHVAGEYVEQLREFVKLVLSQKTSDARNARICRGRQQNTLVGACNHAAKFPEPKWLKPLADAILRKKYRTTVVKFYRNSDQKEHGRKSD